MAVYLLTHSTRQIRIIGKCAVVKQSYGRQTANPCAEVTQHIECRQGKDENIVEILETKPHRATTENVSSFQAYSHSSMQTYQLIF